MKKLISLLLVFVMSLSLICTVSAASPEAKQAADALHELGLFQGVGTNADGTPNYDLDRAPNRMEAVTMLVRLLGKEDEAKAGTWSIPFTDVAGWAKPYVGYAYANKLTNGISATAFGGTDLVTASQYITFVLRALGYDSSTDFKWNAAWELSDKLGITYGQYNASSAFTRGDVAIISNNALSAKLKGTDTTLKERNKKPPVSVFMFLSVLAASSDNAEKKDNDGNKFYSSQFFYEDLGTEGSNHRYVNYFVDYYPQKETVTLTRFDITKRNDNFVVDYYLEIEIPKDFSSPYNVIYMITYENKYSADVNLALDPAKFGPNTKTISTVNNYYSTITESSGLKNHSAEGLATSAADDLNKLLSVTNKELLQPVGYLLSDIGFTNYSSGGVIDAGAKTSSQSTGNQQASADASAYIYTVAHDFGVVKDTYSSATPIKGYVCTYTDIKGHQCVLTVVVYEIIDTYYYTVLRDLTTGETIKEPIDYYDHMADITTGQTSLDYLQQEIDTGGHYANMLLGKEGIQVGPDQMV